MATGSLHKKKLKDASKLLAPLAGAICGGTALNQATRPLAREERESLSRALSTDVDKWRAQFSQELRTTSSTLLATLHRDIEQLEPHNRAYALDVLIRNAALLEGRNLVHASSVNIQVNNYGETSRETLLASLEGAKAVAAQNPLLQAGTERPTLDGFTATPQREKVLVATDSLAATDFGDACETHPDTLIRPETAMSNAAQTSGKPA